MWHQSILPERANAASLSRPLARSWGPSSFGSEQQGARWHTRCQLSKWASSALYWDVKQRQGQQHPNIISLQSPHAFTSSQWKSFVKAASHFKIVKLPQQLGQPLLARKEPVPGWHRSFPTPSTVLSLFPTTTASVFQVREKKINLSQPSLELRVLMIKAKFEPLLQASLKHLPLNTVLFNGCHLCQAISMLSQFARWIAQNPCMILKPNSVFVPKVVNSLSPNELAVFTSLGEQWALMLCPVQAVHSWTGQRASRGAISPLSPGLNPKGQSITK